MKVKSCEMPKRATIDPKEGCDRPLWCTDYTCKPQSGLIVDDCGTCFGFLSVPQNHGEIKAINDLCWCIESHGIQKLYLNIDDIISFILLWSAGLKKLSKTLPAYLVDYMPWQTREK